MFRILTLVWLFVFALLFEGCLTFRFGHVNIIKDDFRNTHIIKMKLLMLSNEPYLDYFGAPTSLKYYFYFDLTREIGPDNKVIPTSIRFSYHGATGDAPIAKTGFLKIGDKISPLIIGNSDSQLVTNTSVTTTTSTNFANTGSDNTNAIMNAKGGFVDFTKVQSSGSGRGNTQTRTSVSSHTGKEQSGMFLLKREDEQAILEGKPFSIRLYMGSYPLTFSFDQENSKHLKNFLLARPEMEKKE
ncbi:hypothetical protein EHQ52_05405 [Leptospira koniambonensis]|uniref:Uncharacterized protein n=1 Tax=Leptospira koniambonensis TaxID=2484950 RepID=A0A4V6QLT5_9LEPT|nr:hypothetical protein [Leptospira koniambonensis]TGL33969.1 hypothetical protein EHQ52_05405 [Leptospira koniambonensis]